MQRVATSPALLILALVVAVILAGCAGPRNLATPEPPPPHPLEGTWSCEANSPRGTFTGQLTFAVAGDSLTGEIAMFDTPSQAVQNLAFDKEASVVTFSFDSGGFGIMDLELTLEGNTLNGVQTARVYNLSVDFTASRKEDEPTAQ